MPASAALLDSTASDRQAAAPEIDVQTTLYETYHLWGPLVTRHPLLCPTGALSCRMASGASDGATSPAAMSSAGNRRSGQRCDDASATDAHYCFCATVSVRATAALTPAWDDDQARVWEAEALSLPAWQQARGSTDNRMVPERQHQLASVTALPLGRRSTRRRQMGSLPRTWR